MFLSSSQICEEGGEMTSLRRRLDNILAELDIIRNGLGTSTEFPPCCLTLHIDGKISCDTNGPLPSEEFLKECRKCKMTMKHFLEQVG